MDSRGLEVAIYVAPQDKPGDDDLRDNLLYNLLATKLPILVNRLATC
jgi:hypothetical protein